jgi:hypothetical protein
MLTDSTQEQLRDIIHEADFEAFVLMAQTIFEGKAKNPLSEILAILFDEIHLEGFDEDVTKNTYEFSQKCTAYLTSRKDPERKKITTEFITKFGNSLYTLNTIESDSVKVYQLLTMIESFDVNALDNKGISLLMHATASHYMYVDLMDEMVRTGANIHLVHKNYGNVINFIDVEDSDAINKLSYLLEIGVSPLIDQDFRKAGESLKKSFGIPMSLYKYWELGNRKDLIELTKKHLSANQAITSVNKLLSPSRDNKSL